MKLDDIVPWGRTRREYEAMFGLTPDDLQKTILDCGGGPSSFTSELHSTGGNAISVDPLYEFSGPDISSRFRAVADRIMDQVRAEPGRWSWRFHENPEELLRSRETALNRFLADYDSGLTEGRYLRGALPRLPFSENRFALSLCSHLLFLYSNLLSADFHIESLLELARISREIRIFPLVDLNNQPSPHLNPVREALEMAGWRTSLIPVGYELQPGGNQMLRITRS